MKSKVISSALQAYLKGLQSGSVNKTTIRPTTQTSSQTQKQTVITTTHATKQTTTSCLQSFFCTKSCPHGYMTDGSGCPLCQCIVPGSSGIVTTSASGKSYHHWWMEIWYEAGVACTMTKFNIMISDSRSLHQLVYLYLYSELNKSFKKNVSNILLFFLLRGS